MSLTASVSCVLLFLAAAKASGIIDANMFPDGSRRFANANFCTSRRGDGGTIDASTYTDKGHDCCYNEKTRNKCCLQLDGEKETFTCKCELNTVCKAPSSSGENINGIAESLCAPDNLMSRIFGGKPVLNGCTYAGIAQILSVKPSDSNVHNKFLCNAVFTTIKVANEKKKMFVIPKKCLQKWNANKTEADKFNAKDTRIDAKIIISGEAFPISYNNDTGYTMIQASIKDLTAATVVSASGGANNSAAAASTSAPGDDGFAYLEIVDKRFHSHFNRLFCNTPACIYKSSMLENIQLGNCKMVSYGPLKIQGQVIEASSNSTLREAKVYLDPLGCTKFPEDKTTSVCFKFSSGKFYTKNSDGGAPVYCKAKSSNEDILIGLADNVAEGITGNDFNEMKVIMVKQ